MAAENPDLEPTETARDRLADGEHTGAHNDEAHELTFREVLREKVISLSTMSRRLRLLTGVAVAQLIVAAVFLSLRNAHLSMTIAQNIANRSSGVVSVPTVVLWISVELLSLAWAYLLVGAFDSALPFRLAALALFSGDVVLLWLNSGFSGVYGGAEAVLLGSVWVVGAWTWRTRTNRLATEAEGAGRSHRLPGFLIGLILAAATGGIYVLFWFGPSRNGPSSQEFASAVFEQLIVMAVILVPALLLAGSEFAEWGEVVGDGIGRVAGLIGRHRTVMTAALTAAVSAAVLVHAALASGARLPMQLLLAAGVAVLLGLAAWGLGRRKERRSIPRVLPYAAVALLAIGFYAVTTSDLLLRTSSPIWPSAREMALGGDLIGYGQASQPRFGIEYPSGWTVHRVPPDYTVFDGTSFGESMTVLDAHVPADQFQQKLGFSPQQAIQELVQALLAGAISPPPRLLMSTNYGQLGPWAYKDFFLVPPGSSKPRVEGVGLERIVNGRVWVLLGSAQAGGFDEAKGQLFRQMALSWTPNPNAYPAATSLGVPTVKTLYPIWSLGFWALAAVAGLLLLLTRGRKMKPTRAAGVLVTLAVALFYVASAGATTDVNGFHFLHLDGVQAAVAVGTLAYVGTCLVRRRSAPGFERRAALLLMLNVGLQIAAWMYQLFGGAAALGGQFSLAQALVVLAALAWELLFSGVTMTNVHSDAFPRHARVVVFCGYILLVAVTVLFFSSLHVQATGSRLEPVFESEMWVQRGIAVLAVPMLISMFVLRWLRGSGARSAADVVAPDAGAAAVTPPSEMPAAELAGIAN